MKTKMVKRFDGREYNEIRRITAEIGVFNNADGSAIFAFGDTVAYAYVYGPRRIPKFLADPDRAILRVRYNMLTFSVPDRKRPGPGRREIELSEIIKRTLESVVILETFPETVIDVYIEIPQADAGTRTAGINAAVLALADAGIPMIDLLASVAVGKVGEKIVIDLTKEEEDYDSEKIKNDPEKKEYFEYYGEGKATDVPLAIIPRKEEISLIQMDGCIDKKDLLSAIKLGIERSGDIVNVMRKAILRKYEKISKDISKLL